MTKDTSQLNPTPIHSSMEPVWTYPTLLSNLESKVDNQYKELNNKIGKEHKLLQDSFTEAVTKINSLAVKIDLDVNKKLNLHTAELLSYKDSIQLKIDGYELQNNKYIKEVCSLLDSFNTRLNNFGLDIEDKPSELIITCTDADYKSKSYTIDKIIADEETITYKNRKLALKQTLHKNDFTVQTGDVIRVKGFVLNSGRSVSADSIHNELSNATYNIKSMMYKLESVIQKLNNVNGYIAANNFKKAEVNQDALTSFAVDCLSTSEHKVTKSMIPAGTKIKNTYDNHIWVYNKVSINGLTTSKWEDFGSDTICVASNNGVHGLVTGSSDKFRGYIDMNGVISINGLEEEFNNILVSLSLVESNLAGLDRTVTEYFSHFEQRLDILEDKLR